MNKSFLTEVAKVREMYEKDPRTNTLNVIVFAPIKVGKTSLLKTCPKPIYVDSFDPGGSGVLKDLIDKGEAIVNSKFEVEDPFNPKAFRLWEDNFKRLISQKFFDNIGTYCLDSVTTWSQCIMYEVVRVAAMKKSQRVIGGAPQQNDWMVQMQHIENYMRLFVSLPCHCVLTGHEDQPTKLDADGNVIFEGDVGLMITGKLRNRVPALFDEIYKLEIDNYQKETRRLVIAPKPKLQVGSRLRKNGLLNTFEPADIKHILKKVGYDHSDKTESLNAIKEMMKGGESEPKTEKE